MNKLTFPSYGLAFNALMDKIVKRKPSLSNPQIIVVPEIYTFAFERAFYSLGRGSFDVRVCSLSKLYHDYCDGKALPRAGAIALIRKILYENKSRLTYYATSFDKRGFASKVYETIEKLYSSGIEPCQLSSDNSGENIRLKDLKLVYLQYLEQTHGQKVDAVGKIHALDAFIKNNATIFKNSDFYFANFDVFNKAQNQLIQTLDDAAKSVSVYSSDFYKGYKVPKKTSVFRAQSCESELKQAVRVIKNAVVDGARYSDFSVVSENINYEALKRIFDENDIPFYYDNKVSLSNYEEGRFILSAISAHNMGAKREKVLELARNSLALSVEERDAFVRYASFRLVNFKGFYKEFTEIDEFDFCKTAELARQKLVKIMNCFSGVDDAISLVSAVDKALRLAGGLDQSQNKTTTHLTNCVITLSEVFCEQKYSLEQLANALEEMLSGVSLPVIPNQSDCVLVGSVNSRRGLPSKHLIVLGFNDGVLPKQTDAPDLIGESLLDELDGKGVKIEPRNEQMNQRFRDEIMQAMNAAEILHISYVSDGNNKKSYLLTLIEKFNAIIEYSEKDYDAILKESAVPSEIAKAVPTKSLCIEKTFSLPLGKNHGSLSEAVEREKTEIEKSVNRKQEQYLIDGYQLKNISVSRLKSYFDCPRSYYFRHILGIEELKTGEVDVLDVGNVLHAIVEHFVARRGEMPTEDLASAIIEQEVDKLVKSDIAENKRIIEIIKKDGMKLCACAESQINKGKFKPEFLEREFNSVELKTDKGNSVYIRGKIDRADVYENYARVIDYKTGKKVEFSAPDVYYGTKLQLPVYCAVMKNEGYKIAGMFYFPVSADISSMLIGYSLDDDEVICAMDSDAFNGEKSQIIKFENKFKKGTNSFEKKGKLWDESQIEQVISYSKKCATTAVNEIQSGYIAGSPMVYGNDKSVCDYCPYRQACFTSGNIRQRTKVTWENVMEAGKQ